MTWWSSSSERRPGPSAHHGGFAGCCGRIPNRPPEPGVGEGRVLRQVPRHPDGHGVVDFEEITKHIPDLAKVEKLFKEAQSSAPAAIKTDFKTMSGVI